MDEYPVLLKKGLAKYLHTQNIGFYKATGSYTTAETEALPGVITSGDVPTSIDNCLVIAVGLPIYTGRADIETPVQIFSRLSGARSVIENFSTKLRDSLHNKSHILFEGLPISLIQYRNGLIFEKDSNSRYASNQTFYLRGRKPSH